MRRLQNTVRRSVRINRRRVDLRSRSCRAVQHGVICLSCGPNRGLNIGRLYSSLSVKHAPIHRTLIHLTRRNLIHAIPRDNACISPVGLALTRDTYCVHRRLRGRIVIRYYTQTASTNVRRLSHTVTLRRGTVTRRSHVNFFLDSGLVRRVVFDVTYHDAI